MEIPYGKREFIVEEEEQQHPPQQQVVHPVEEPSIRITQENCHAPAQKMVVVQEQHVHAHLLVSRPWSYSYIILACSFSSRQCKRIMNRWPNGWKHKRRLLSTLKYVSRLRSIQKLSFRPLFILETLSFVSNAQSSSTTSAIDHSCSLSVLSWISLCQIWINRETKCTDLDLRDYSTEGCLDRAHLMGKLRICGCNKWENTRSIFDAWYPGMKKEIGREREKMFCLCRWIAEEWDKCSSAASNESTMITTAIGITQISSVRLRSAEG